MSSVTSIYFPGADALPYVASLIGSANGVETLAISCGAGVNSATCGFPSSVTVTAGPSTAYVSVSNQEATFIYDCKISALTAAVCAETFNGNDAYIATSSGASTLTVSTVTTETLGSTDITWMPITITAGLSGVKTGGAATATASATAIATGAAGTDAWGNYGSSASASTPGTNTASTPTWGSTPGTASSPTTTPGTNTMTSGSNSGASWSGVSLGSTAPAGWNGTTNPVPSVSMWTGAADRLAVVGSFAAGLLALAAGFVV